MALADLTSRTAVLDAIAEYDELGPQAFLEKYGFSPARTYLLRHQDRDYDSKAIAGAAHGYEHPELGPLRAADFSGGVSGAAGKLESLGFEIVGRVEAGEPIHLVLKWSGSVEPRTIDHHRDVAEQKGSVWWGRQSKPGSRGIAAHWIERLRQQLVDGIPTHVYLHGPSTWDTRLHQVETDESSVDFDRVPSYYRPDTHHSLWVQISDFEPARPEELTEEFVLARSGDPVTFGGLGNQSPLIIRAADKADARRYFILSQAQSDGEYDDIEGTRYHWTDRSSGASKQLARSPGSGFVYYRPGRADDNTSQTYFGFGRVGTIQEEERGDGLHHYTAELQDYQPFATPIPWREGPSRSAQTSIQAITRAQFEHLVEQGRTRSAGIAFDVGTVRAAADRKGLRLLPHTYAAVVAALESGKHVILTGPPGTAKTTLAQVLAEAGAEARRCEGYVLTTATADWTTYETIGGLRPTEAQTLEFEEGHFLKAVRANRWLVIDELNRSNFDRAFGQLFTVLSGQPVVLPYTRPGQTAPLTLVPAGASPPNEEVDILQIPESWRVIGTMNVFDKSLLFEMSFAMMRRFAFIEVSPPEDAVFYELIDGWSEGDIQAADIAKSLLAVRKIKDIGPAVYRDIARYATQRRRVGEVDEGALIFEGFYSYLLPQFEGIDDEQGIALFKLVSPLVGQGRSKRLRTTLNSVLGVDLAGAPSDETEPEELELDVEPEDE
jgi:MoxR-like ATPase